MVRSVIPDSDQESGEEVSPYAFSSTSHGAATQQQSPTVRTASQNRDNVSTLPTKNQDDMTAQSYLGTGSTDSAVFQQIYNQHQDSTDATLHTPVSQPNNREQIISALSHDGTPVVSISKVTQLTPPPPTKATAPSSSASSSTTIKKLKRSKTDIQDLSFASPEAMKKESKMKRAKSMKSYHHTIEGSSQDITVPVTDMGEYTKLSQGSMTYRKVHNEKHILSPENASHAQKDIYEFPGSSEPKQITKKVGSKTTMDILGQKTAETYGKIRRTKTMVAPSSSPSAPFEDPRRKRGETRELIGMSDARLPSSLPAQEQRPRASLKENIQRKKEEKAIAAQKEKEVSGRLEVETGVEAKAKSLVQTYGKIRRSTTGVLSGSPTVGDIDSKKKAIDDNHLADKHKKRKSNIQANEEELFELPKAKRYQRSKSAAAAAVEDNNSVTPFAEKQAVTSEVAVLSYPVMQIPDMIETPTASMPTPLLENSTDTVLVPGTTSQQSTAGKSNSTKVVLQVDNSSSLVVDSNVSVVTATKSFVDKASFVGHGHPGTPKLACFASSQEQADAVRSVLKKVDEIVNSPAVAADAALGAESDASSSLSISFDRGLTGRSIVLVPEPTDSQKEQYKAVSVTDSDEGGAREHAASLPQVMSPARAEMWSGASSTVANSTWKDRDSGGQYADKRAPIMEALSSQPRPSSRRANKRSKTGLENTTPTRRGRSASVVSDAPISCGGYDVVVKSTSRKIGRRKTMSVGEEPAKSSSQLRRTHVVKTVTAYEKLKGPDTTPPSFPEVAPSSEVIMADTQPESIRGTKRKSIDADADADIDQDPQPLKSQGKTQEDLDFEMAKKLQEEMDKDDAEPDTRAKRRAPLKPAAVGPELEAPEMYKPRLSSRRSKSLSAKADPSAVETFIDGLPRPRKGKGKKAGKDKDSAALQEVKTSDKGSTESPKGPAPNASMTVDAVDNGDIVMDDVAAPIDDEDTIVVATERPKPSLNKDKPTKEAAITSKPAALPKKVGRAASKPIVATTVAKDGHDEDAVVAPKKRGRNAKTIIEDTDASADELSLMDMDDQPAVTAAPHCGRGAAQKSATSTAGAAKPPPKFREIVDEELPVKPAARSSRAKHAEKQAAAKPPAKSKEIVDTDDDDDDDEDEDEEESPEPASPIKAQTPVPPPAAVPTPLNNPRGVTRKISTPGFKAPTMSRTESTSVETDIPQTPRKYKGQKQEGQGLTPNSTPPGTVSHSPLRGGVVPLRVGLSKKTRLPSLLKIIRK